MPYGRFRIENKWLILLLIGIVVTVIFMVLSSKEIKRKAAPLKGIIFNEIAGMPESSSTNKPGKPFTVQVWSFQDKNKAELASERLKKQNYPAYIVTQELEKKGIWYRVWVGAFETKEEATKLVKEIRKDYKDSFVTSR